MNNIIEKVWKQQGLTPIEFLPGNTFTAEAGAHTFIISGVDQSGAEVALSGSPSASFIRADGTTVAISSGATLTNGKVYVTLPDECYGVTGRFALTVFLTSNGQKVAIYACVGNVARSNTSAVSPGVTADVVDLVNRIDTARASIPATYTALLAAIAEDYTDTSTYKKGDFRWYSGTLYRAKQDIETAESWTAGHWTQVTLANSLNDELTDLKSALSGVKINFIENGYIAVNGTDATNNEYRRTGYIRFSNKDKFYLSGFRNGVSSLAYAFYSSNDASSFISGAGELDGDLSSESITIPENTKYIRFSTWYDVVPNAYIVMDNIYSTSADGAIVTTLDYDNTLQKEAAVYDWDENGWINSNGRESTNDEYRRTKFIPFDNTCKFVLSNFYNGSALAYAFYSAEDVSAFISGAGNIRGDVYSKDITIPPTTKFVRFSTWYASSPNACIYINTSKMNATSIEQVKQEVGEKISEATPDNSTFFTRDNWFDINNTIIYTDRFVNVDGKINSSSGTTTIVFPVKPNTQYYFDAPTANRGIIGERPDNNFEIGVQSTLLYSQGQAHPIQFTTGATAKYVAIYMNAGAYDWNTYADRVVLNIGEYTGNTDKNPYIAKQYMPKNMSSVLENTQVLIFGDSITDTCNFTINASKETTAMAWRNPSNSYTDAGGNVIQYSMWPKILKVSQPCAEVRNYARSGASYKTREREAGEERQNLHYQIDVALNDLDNPHGVFDINNFVPDIVIFALGTNDGDPNDTYDSAMSKTVYKSGGVTIDVDATIANLDETKFCESARKAYLRVKNAFPVAQIFVVLPIQRADRDNFGDNRRYLKEMAQRYGSVVIDGAGECGITRDFNNWNTLGTYLKDGLHPNEKGQNLMARMIIASLLAHFIPFGTGFNVLT